MKIAGVIIISSALAAFAGISHADRQKLVMDELVVLDKQEAWQEVLAHLEDIVPSKRDATWKAIAERAGTGYLATLDDRGALLFSEDFLHEFPQLKQSKAFMAKRVAAAFPAFETCFKDSKDNPRSAAACSDRLLAFVDADPGNVDLILRAAHLVGGSAARQKATALFKRALAGKKPGAKECSDEKLAVVVTTALALAPEDTLVSDARGIAKDLCWDALKDALVDRFIDDSSSPYRKNTCDFLSAKSALSTLSLKKCAALTTAAKPTK